MPRTILYTGKGGVGKTSVAAATAIRSAAAGARTLVMSTDPAHSLAESLGATVGDRPALIAPNLAAQQVEAQREMERHWSAVQAWLGDLLMERGVDRLSAEELTVPPGMDELFSLLQLKAAHDAGNWDVIVVDCAPTGETLRLLSFPDVARWWLEKVFPWEKQLLAAARPLARSLFDIPVPSEAVFKDVQRLSENLIALNALMRDTTQTSVRLVMNPDRMVIGEAMRTFTYLNLYGYLTDAVVVNRIFPAEVGAYFGAWRERQQEHLALVDSAFAPVPVLRAPYFAEEVVGHEMLVRLGDAIFADRDAAGLLCESLTQELEITAGGATLRLDLPFTEKGEISLKKIGAELVVRAGGQKRTIMLPAGLAEATTAGASFTNGALEVAFDGA
jgi:arsenite/tail-anchored protein-transporting ATPase